MKGYPSSRAIIASKQRITPRSVGNLLSWSQPGSGIFNHTISANETLTEEVVARTYDNGTPYFLVRSEKFPDRYYIVHEDASGWHVYGVKNQQLADRYIAKAEVFRAESAIEEVVEVAAASDGEGVDNVNALTSNPVEEVVAASVEADAPTPSADSPGECPCPEGDGMMISLTLLDVDQLSGHGRATLGYIIACYGVFVIAIYPGGAMHCLVPCGLEDALLTTISRDIAPVDVLHRPSHAA